MITHIYLERLLVGHLPDQAIHSSIVPRGKRTISGLGALGTPPADSRIVGA